MKNPKALTRLLKKEQPKTLSDFKKLFKLKQKGSGAFRICYELVGWNAVVKIPRYWDEENIDPSDGNLCHAQNEINQIRKIMRNKKYKPLRTFVPDVYYVNKKYGVIVMKKYKKMRSNSKEGEYVARLLQQVFNSFLGKKVIDDSDVSSWNIAKDIVIHEYESGYSWKEFGGYKVFDLGMV